MLGSFTNISDAILNRSVGPLLLSLPFWPVRWLIVILIRFVLYFDPLILLFCGIYIYYFVRKLLKKKLDNFDLMVLLFWPLG
jgi:hypothetical protein